MTSYTYDPVGRNTVVTLPGGNTVQTTFTNSAIVTVTDQVNRKIKRETDGLGRLIKVTEQDVATGALTQETTYTYDLADRLIGVNQGNQTRAFKYDSEGKLLFERIPEQTATINDGTGTLWTSKYTYTDWGALATKQDARGVITTFGYDSLHRLISVSYNTVSGVTTAPAVSYNYDNTVGSATKGLLLSLSVGSGYSETYSYSVGYGNGGNGGNKVSLASVTRVMDGLTYVTSYQYNAANQLTQITYPSGLVIGLSHDNKGRITSVGSFLSGVTYNGIGQLTGTTLGNAVTESFGYDANRMQLTSQVATQSGGSPGGLMNLTYSYQASAGQMGAGTTAGNAGQLMSISGTIGGVTESAAYRYDDLGRLVTSNQTSNTSSAQRRFAYDRWGNRTGMWDAVSGGNQIQSITLQQSGGAPTNRITSVTGGSTVNYSYDAAANVTNDGVHSYGYDSENRIVSLDGGSTASYAYDNQNRRYKKTIGATVTHYPWEGSQVIAEHNGSTGAVLIDYIYSGRRMIAKIASGSTQYFLSDRLSSRLSLDQSGNVVGRQGHLPFGEDFGESGSQEKHHVTNYERDGESGTDYAVNRQYSQSIGRFNRVDPTRASLRDPQSFNKYAYVRNNPINALDPLGLFMQCDLIGFSRLAGWVPGEEEPESMSQTTETYECYENGISLEPIGLEVELREVPLPADLRKRFRDLLNSRNGDCGKFVRNLIHQVASDTGKAAFSDDPMALFDMISGQGGYVLKEVTIDGRSAGGTVSGSLAAPETNPATVLISPRQAAVGAPSIFDALQNSYVGTALHETIHLASTQSSYTDLQLADAVFNLGGLSEAEKDAYNRIDRSDPFSASAFWNGILTKKCN